MNEFVEHEYTLEEIKHLYGLSPSDLITVCSACHCASCWSGDFYCDQYRSATIIRKTVRELLALGHEHPHYWHRE